MTNSEFRAITDSIDGLKDLVQCFQETTRKNFKDTSSSLTEVVSAVGEIKGRVGALEQTVQRQEAAVIEVIATQARSDETIKILKSKTSKDSWRNIPIMIRSPFIKRLAIYLLFGLFLAVAIATLLFLASFTGKEVVIRTPSKPVASIYDTPTEHLKDSLGFPTSHVISS